MITLWIAAALLSAATAGLVVYRAARGRRMQMRGGENPSIGVYRRQLAELDDLSERGLLPQDERRSARAEAARRLLSAADDAAPSLQPAGSGGVIVTVLAAAVPLAAFALYLVVGSPQVPDQPYLRRVAVWRESAKMGLDTSGLDLDQQAAVMQVVAAEHPHDALPLYYLGHIQFEGGDAFSAERSLQKAIKLDPNRAPYWVALGEAFMVEANGDMSGDALTAFKRAAALDPSAAGPRFYLARAKIVAGDTAGGLADWRALAAQMPADDPRKPLLLQNIDAVARTGALPSQAPPPAPAVGAEQQAFIRSMVDGLAARLRAQPDDPAGWGRLIRSYTVLGDTQRLNAARARAEQLFKNRPEALRTLQNAIGGGS
jgi:cytochrome c-type biogenesis protein CcmH